MDFVHDWQAFHQLSYFPATLSKIFIPSIFSLWISVQSVYVVAPRRTNAQNISRWIISDCLMDSWRNSNSGSSNSNLGSFWHNLMMSNLSFYSKVFFILDLTNMGKLLLNSPSPEEGRMKEASQQRKKKTGREIGFLRTALSGRSHVNLDQRLCLAEAVILPHLSSAGEDISLLYL